MNKIRSKKEIDKIKVKSVLKKYYNCYSQYSIFGK